LEANFDEICTEISGQYEFWDGGHVDSYGRSVTSGTSHASLDPRSLVSYGCPHFQPSSALKLLNNTVFLPHFIAISKAVVRPEVFWDEESVCSYGIVSDVTDSRNIRNNPKLPRIWAKPRPIFGSNFRMILLSEEEDFAIFVAACQNDRIFAEFFAKNFPFSLVSDLPQDRKRIPK
jgi:hypothetical protein